MDRRVQSLEPILEEVRGERQARLQHFDALDAKAGIILGFAGALVALTPSGSALIDAGRFAAVASGLLALWTFWPRTYGTTDLRNLRDHYLAAAPGFTKLRLLDTQIAMAEAHAASLQRKALRLKLAMTSLAVGAFLTALGLGLD